MQRRVILSAEARRVSASIAPAATCLAAGLDPDKVCFYRQSDIPEIPALIMAADLRCRQATPFYTDRERAALAWTDAQ